MVSDLGSLLDGDVSALVAAVHAGEVDPSEIAEAAAERARSAPAAALVAVDGEVTSSQARELASRLASGERPPLAGVPVAHKDLMDSAPFPTTSGNPALTRRPPRSATAVARSVGAGCLEVGKANLHEVAYGVTGRNPRTGTPVNPAAPDRMPGGSSSGSASAVSARTVMASLGTDTGGSVRIPAACCGVVGLKVTRGLVPTTGVTPLSWLQDTVGPIARSADDAAQLLAVVVGPDREDPVARHPQPTGWAVTGDLPELGGVTVVTPPELWDRRVDPAVASAARSGVSALEDAGARMAVRSFGAYDAARSAQGTLLSAHAYAIHRERFEADPSVFEPDTADRLAAARDLHHWEVVEALRARERWMAELDELTRDGAVLIASPTLPMPVPAVDAEAVLWDDGEEPITPALTRLTNVWNLSGNPAVSVPCGWVEDAPVGLQLAGRWWSEPLLLSAAMAVEAWRRTS
jgi:aspartyl-tRNA(Asn)/glutamyl-tRNA(Gln) amidotransferase subunit A